MNIENRGHSNRRAKLTWWTIACATIAVSVLVALSGVLWGARGVRPINLRYGIAAASEPKSTALNVSGDAGSRLHDEVQYFEDIFSEEEQQLQTQPVAAHVQAF